MDVADPDPKRLAEAKNTLQCGTFPTIEKLLKTTKAELVVIATPSFRHEADTLAVLKSGRHCVLEKPMAMSYSGARRLIAASKKYRKKLFVHQNYRFKPVFLHFQEIINSGVLGRIFEVRTFWENYARRNDWQTLRKNGGGVLNNTCPHAIDMVLSLINSPIVNLLSDLQHIKDAGDCEDHVRIWMKAKNGCVADIGVGSVNAIPLPMWTILGSNGTLQSDEKTTTLKYYNPKAVPKLKVVDAPAPERKYGTGEILPWKAETRPSVPSKKYGNFYDNVFEVLRKKGKMVVTPEFAAENIRIIEWTRKGTKFPSIKSK